MKIEYRKIYLPDGSFIQIKFEFEGIVYDRFNKDNEHIESCGYDFYEETVIPDNLQYKEIE